MPKAKLGKTEDGKDLHYSAAAIIKLDQGYVLLDRANPPFGFASPAGHIDNEDFEQEDDFDTAAVNALKREVKEETNLDVVCFKKLAQEYIPWNWCSKGVEGHEWFLFEVEVEVTGNIKRNERETKSIGVFTKDEIKQLKLEPVWEYWFKKLEII